MSKSTQFMLEEFSSLSDEDDFFKLTDESPRLPALIYRQPNINSPKDIADLKPFYDLLTVIDTMTLEKLDESDDTNKELLFNWRQSVYNTVSQAVINWQREGSNSLSDEMNKFSKVLTTSISTCLIKPRDNLAIIPNIKDDSSSTQEYFSDDEVAISSELPLSL